MQEKYYTLEDLESDTPVIELVDDEEISEDCQSEEKRSVVHTKLGTHVPTTCLPSSNGIVSKSHGEIFDITSLNTSLTSRAPYDSNDSKSIPSPTVTQTSALGKDIIDIVANDSLYAVSKHKCYVSKSSDNEINGMGSIKCPAVESHCVLSEDTDIYIDVLGSNDPEIVDGVQGVVSECFKGSSKTDNTLNHESDVEVLSLSTSDDDLEEMDTNCLPSLFNIKLGMESEEQGFKSPTPNYQNLLPSQMFSQSLTYSRRPSSHIRLLPYERTILEELIEHRDIICVSALGMGLHRVIAAMLRVHLQSELPLIDASKFSSEKQKTRDDHGERGSNVSVDKTRINTIHNNVLFEENNRGERGPALVANDINDQGLRMPDLGETTKSTEVGDVAFEIHNKNEDAGERGKKPQQVTPGLVLIIGGTQTQKDLIIREMKRHMLDDWVQNQRKRRREGGHHRAEDVNNNDTYDEMFEECIDGENNEDINWYSDSGQYLLPYDVTAEVSSNIRSAIYSGARIPLTPLNSGTPSSSVTNASSILSPSSNHVFPTHHFADRPHSCIVRCCFITARILVVDCLSGRVPAPALAGMVVLNAHYVTESNGEGFALRLFSEARSQLRSSLVSAHERRHVLKEGSDSGLSTKCDTTMPLLSLSSSPFVPASSSPVTAADATAAGGFIRAFSDNASYLMGGFSRIEAIMKACRTTRLSLWPRFQVQVAESLDSVESSEEPQWKGARPVVDPEAISTVKGVSKDDSTPSSPPLPPLPSSPLRSVGPKVVEWVVSLSPFTRLVQAALIELLASLLAELKRTNPRLDATELSLEEGVFKAFDMRIRRQLDPIWHSVGWKTKQLCRDLQTVRELLSFLVVADSVSFLSRLETLRQTEGVRCIWIFLDPAHVLFEQARRRVYVYHRVARFDSGRKGGARSEGVKRLESRDKQREGEDSRVKSSGGNGAVLRRGAGKRGEDRNHEEDADIEPKNEVNRKASSADSEATFSGCSVIQEGADPDNGKSEFDLEEWVETFSDNDSGVDDEEMSSMTDSRPRLVEEMGRGGEKSEDEDNDKEEEDKEEDGKEEDGKEEDGKEEDGKEEDGEEENDKRAKVKEGENDFIDEKEIRQVYDGKNTIKKSKGCESSQSALEKEKAEAKTVAESEKKTPNTLSHILEEPPKWRLLVQVLQEIQKSRGRTKANLYMADTARNVNDPGNKNSEKGDKGLQSGPILVVVKELHMPALLRRVITEGSRGPMISLFETYLLGKLRSRFESRRESQESREQLRRDPASSTSRSRGRGRGLGMRLGGRSSPKAASPNEKRPGAKTGRKRGRSNDAIGKSQAGKEGGGKEAKEKEEETDSDFSDAEAVVDGTAAMLRVGEMQALLKEAKKVSKAREQQMEKEKAEVTNASVMRPAKRHQVEIIETDEKFEVAGTPATIRMDHESDPMPLQDIVASGDHTHLCPTAPPPSSSHPPPFLNPSRRPEPIPTPLLRDVIFVSLDQTCPSAAWALWRRRPSHVVMYDMDLAFLRQVEVFAAECGAVSSSSLPPQPHPQVPSSPPLELHLLSHDEDSFEQQRFRAVVDRERAAFESLIEAKGRLAVRIGFDELGMRPVQAMPAYDAFIAGPKGLSEADLWLDLYQLNALTRKAGGQRGLVTSSPSSSSSAAAASRSLSSSGAASNALQKQYCRGMANGGGVAIVVDIREFMSSLPAVLHSKGFVVQPVTLEVGDYVLSPEIVVERKALPDLVQSLGSGRLFNQAEAMTKHYPTAVLLVEFEADRAFRAYLGTSLGSSDMSSGGAGIGGNSWRVGGGGGGGRGGGGGMFFRNINRQGMGSIPASSTLSDDIDPKCVMSKMTLLIIHFPRLRIIWSRSPHATADMFAALKSRQDEPDVAVAAAVGGEGGSWGRGGGEDEKNSGESGKKSRNAISEGSNAMVISQDLKNGSEDKKNEISDQQLLLTQMQETAMDGCNVSIPSQAPTPPTEVLVNEVAIEVLKRLPGVTATNYRAVMALAPCLAQLTDVSLDELEQAMGSRKNAKLLKNFLDGA